MNTLSPCRSILPVRKFWLMSLALLALASLTAAQAARIDRYVDKASATPSLPYDAWTNAAPDIQSAVDAAVAAQGDQVIVRAGVYDTGGRLTGWSYALKPSLLTNRVVIAKGITVRSELNDPEHTIIQGNWHPGTTNGISAVRCVYLSDASARLIGFTLTNGATLDIASVLDPSFGIDLSGGGIYTPYASTMISNCVIIGNAGRGCTYNGDGAGGAWGGTYWDCSIVNNFSETYGGGTGGGGTGGGYFHGCLIAGNRAGISGGAGFRVWYYDCVVSNNWAGSGFGGGICGFPGSATLRAEAYDTLFVTNRAAVLDGGAAYNASLYRCRLVYNSSKRYGGGAAGGIASDCTVVSNVATSGGGGIYSGVHSNTVFACNVSPSGPGGGASFATLYNCLVYGNQGSDGGGVYESSLMNCTVVGNYSVYNGGGVAVWGGTRNVGNSIIYGNKAGISRADCGGNLILSNCCYTLDAGHSLIAINNSTTNHPLLMDMGSGYGTNHLAGNYRLRGTSPCLNTGLTLSWMTGLKDLDGNPRLDKMSGIVDMGSYEYVYTGTTILIR